ncbi:MAG: pyridoxal 5'-phosphate synthase glutaminase subunit PdxT [Clostridium perfringens]|nr:pyridoxal 5'-phosphate synthase glutaminase subunit PdxT [Clostridium perfringens]
MKIGVLAFQGGVIEHIKQIESLGHKAIEVKKEEDLEELGGIILPGGESTTMGKLLKITNLLEPLRKKIEEGLPTFGTCAGMILLAKEIEGENSYLNLMNIKIKRNAFGRQLDSFSEYHKVKGIQKDIELVFIRAPYVEEVGENVDVLCKVREKVVAVKENNIIATSFHPELTDDLTFMKYFLSICN